MFTSNFRNGHVLFRQFDGNCVSAVVFLYAADFKLAAVSIVNMDDAGNVAPAAAMSVLIVVTNIVVRVVYEWGTKALRNRTSQWQKR